MKKHTQNPSWGCGGGDNGGSAGCWVSSPERVRTYEKEKLWILIIYISGIVGVKF